MFQRLATLPRDARDTLFLLAVIAWVVLPQVGNLPLWCSLVAACILVWRGSLALQSKPLPSRWWVLAVLVATLAATYTTHRTLLGRDAGVTLVVLLLALKTLELRAKRDAFVVFFLSFFTMLTNFFFSQSLLTAAAMLLALLGLLTALVNAHMPVGKPPLLLAAKTAGWMTLLGAPVMAVLFVLFPRLAPLWGVPSDALSGRSGLSSSMQVGQIAKLALDETIALRVKFENNFNPPQNILYIRGPVLSSFDGKSWQPLESRLPQRMRLAADLIPQGPPLRYEVTLEPNNRPWVFVLDAALEAPGIPGIRLSMTPDLLWLADRPITDLTRYQVSSFTSFKHGPERFQPGLQDFLNLPPGSNPRTVQLASQIRTELGAQSSNTPALVAHAMNRLKTGGYSYTLEPGLYGQHTADEFWFDRKEGFCEHIASSFVILMRALDVPARIVTGYQGGERNGVDGYWVLRQSDAHAWAEVWTAGQGWVRVDPTGAVSPGRVGAFTRLQAPQGVLAGAFSGVFGNINVGALANLRAAWEAVNNSWNQWVLSYSQAKQLNLLKDIGFETPGWETLAQLLLGLLIGTSTLGALWSWWDKHRHDPWLRLWRKAQSQFHKAGIAVPAQAPPRTMAALLPTLGIAQASLQTGTADPWLANRQWLLALENLRYAALPAAATGAALQQLKKRFNQLTWPAPGR